MNSRPPADELATLRDLLNRLETGELTLRRGSQDVSKHESSVLKSEIARLEKVLERIKLEGASDKPINYAGRTKRFLRNDK
jgi:hypothetical protein